MKLFTPFLLLAIFSLFVQPTVTHAADQENIFTDTSELTKLCIVLIQNEQYEKLAQLFHFPVNYSDQDKNADITAIQEGMAIFAEEFGSLLYANPLKNDALYVNLQVGTGNVPYWKGHPDFTSVVFMASFQKENDAFIIFWLVNISGKLEVRSIGYGLPADDPTAVDRIKPIGKKLFDQLMSIDNRPKDV